MWTRECGIERVTKDSVKVEDKTRGFRRNQERCTSTSFFKEWVSPTSGEERLALSP